MKILVIAGTYPHPGHLFSGVFNEKCVVALRDLCDYVEVLAPRPYVPPGFSFMPRWKAYSAIKGYEVRNGVAVHRPPTPVIPRVGAALWVDLAPFLSCRALAGRLHRRTKFDAIISFDLVQAGGLAWRIGKDLGIPAAGWAFGNDIRHPKLSPLGGVVARAIERLHVVFYQSRELFEKGASLLGLSPDRMPCDRHVILPHGIPPPPPLPRRQVRDRIRQEWGIPEGHAVVLYTGRIFREKGVFELLEAVSLAASRDSRITCVVVGSHPAYDETGAVIKKLDDTLLLKERVRVLPVCNPDKVWEYLCAADIFAFPSHKEGMSNSLLEAMIMGVPAVAFAIPSVLEIGAETEALLMVPPFDSELFSEAILRLAASPDERVRIGEIAKGQVMGRFMVRKNMAKALDHLVQVIEERKIAMSLKKQTPLNEKHRISATRASNTLDCPCPKPQFENQSCSFL